MEPVPQGPILSQYNPHGVFIALEELGFLAMGLSFAFLALALGSSRLERVTRRVYLVSTALIVAAFVGMSWYFGFGLEYRFEVTAISFGWLTLMISGVLLAFVFRLRPRQESCSDSSIHLSSRSEISRSAL